MLKLVFALPEEARIVRRRVRDVFGGQEVSLSFVGVGARHIAELERSIELTKPRMVISSGFAGATRSLLEPGDFVLATNYTDADIAESLSRQKVFDAAGPFVQVQQVASASAKWSLNHSPGALAVDMESAEIANLCRRTGLPLVTARMISDAMDEAIPAIFSKRRFSGLKDLGDAAVFAARMLRLTGKLADRLEALVRALPRSES
jgi:nucleoside phosphorylase